MTANPWRGETEIVLGGKSYVLRPTFEALSRIEQKLDMGLIALARRLAGGHVTLEELVVIIAQCMREDAPVREALVQGGISQALETVCAMFALIFGGFDEIAG